MNEREKYRQVHQEWMRAVYLALVWDRDLYDNLTNVMGRLTQAAFDFGAAEAKKSIGDQST